MKVCRSKDCPLQGEPQPTSNFYRTKSICRICCRAANREHRERKLKRLANSPYVVDREPSGNLDIGPWREWVLRQVEISGGIKGGGVQIVAWELGFSERAISRWIHESVRVRLDIVDSALCKRGTPWVLRELYPSLYEFEDAA